jgi:hypothetical protein
MLNVPQLDFAFLITHRHKYGSNAVQRHTVDSVEVCLYSMFQFAFDALSALQDVQVACV